MAILDRVSEEQLTIDSDSGGSHACAMGTGTHSQSALLRPCKSSVSCPRLHIHQTLRIYLEILTG